MKAYTTDESPHPGCGCCVTRQGHGARTQRASETKTRAQRAGRKASRQAGKREIRDQQ